MSQTESPPAVGGGPGPGAGSGVSPGQAESGGAAHQGGQEHRGPGDNDDDNAASCQYLVTGRQSLLRVLQPQLFTNIPAALSLPRLSRGIILHSPTLCDR